MIEIKCVAKDGAKLPNYQTKGAAGADICAFLDSPVVLQKGKRELIPTGLSFEIPEGYEGIVRGRSGLASNGIQVHLGTIDENYVGDIGIIITNNSSKLFYVTKGAKLAQFTIKPVYRIDLVEVQKIKDTERGESGYGSSGF